MVILKGQSFRQPRIQNQDISNLLIKSSNPNSNLVSKRNLRKPFKFIDDNFYKYKLENIQVRNTFSFFVKNYVIKKTKKEKKNSY